MASLLLGTNLMASHLVSLSFSHSHSVAALSLSSHFTFSLSTSSAAASSPVLPLIYCGRGDRKTARGKRFNHSFGNARPRNKKMGRGPPKSPIPPATPKKDPFDNDEKIKIEIDDE